MRDEDRLDRVGVDAEAVEADEGRGAAVDEEAGLGRLDVIAGLQAPARAEGVAATYNRQFHGIPCCMQCVIPQGVSMVGPVCLFPR